MAGFHQLPYKLHVDELSCTKLTLQFLRLFALYYRLLCYYSFLLLILLREFPFNSLKFAYAPH